MRKQALVLVALLAAVLLATGGAKVSADESGDEKIALEVEETEELAVEEAEAITLAPPPAHGPNGNGVVIVAPPEEDEDMTGITQEEQKKISISLQDVELEKVVKLFMRMTDANIMYTGTNLQGTVSVNLKNVEWKPALEAILAQKDLVMTDSGQGVYSIVKKQPGAPEPLIVEAIFLKYADIQQVSSTVRGSLDPRGKISEFPSRNAIVIRSTRPNIGEIREIVNIIDVPRGQVFIEAKFMELNDTAIRHLGVNWQMLQAYEVAGAMDLLDRSVNYTESSSRSGSQTQGDTRSVSDAVSERYRMDGEKYETVSSSASGGDVVETVTPTRTRADSIGRSFGVSSTLSDSMSRSLTDARAAVLSPLQFNLILSALKSESGVSIVSNPKILVANSEPAVIHIGEKRRPLIPETSTAQDVVQTVYKPGPEIESGVKLTVTPTINTESNITVEIKPKISRILPEGDWTTAPDGSKYPATSDKEITTVFSLFSGETAAIGGLTETRDDNLATKVPILGDIPLLGKYFFSHNRKEKIQQETIIFVTVALADPDRIVRDVGLPEDAKLVHKRLIQREIEQREFDQELGQMKNAAREREKNSEKRRRLLLRRTR